MRQNFFEYPYKLTLNVTSFIFNNEYATVNPNDAYKLYSSPGILTEVRARKDTVAKEIL